MKTNALYYYIGKMKKKTNINISIIYSISLFSDYAKRKLKKKTIHFLF